MKSNGLSFHHPLLFWIGCAALVAGVLAHIPMFLMASNDGFRMVGHIAAARFDRIYLPADGAVIALRATGELKILYGM